MSLFEVGRVCIKLAGRDAGRKCVVISKESESLVLVDGNVRRRKVNVKHLEPLAQVLDVHANSASSEVKKAFEKEGWKVWETKGKRAAERPRRQRKKKAKPAKPESTKERSMKPSADLKKSAEDVMDKGTPGEKAV